MITTWIHNLFSKNKIEEEVGYGEMSRETREMLGRLSIVGRILGFIILCLGWGFGFAVINYFFILKDWFYVIMVGGLIMPIAAAFSAIGLARVAKWVATGDSDIGLLDWLGGE